MLDSESRKACFFRDFRMSRLRRDGVALKQGNDFGGDVFLIERHRRSIDRKTGTVWRRGMGAQPVSTFLFHRAEVKTMTQVELGNQRDKRSGVVISPSLSSRVRIS